MQFANIFTAAHAHIVNDKPIADAARGAFHAIAKEKPTLVGLFVAMMGEEQTRKTADAAGMAGAAAMRCILEKDGVDLESRRAISAALWPHAAEAAGFTYVPGQAKEDRNEAEAAAYQKVATRINRAVHRIMGTDPVSMRAKQDAGIAAEAVPAKGKRAARVPGAIMAVVVARKDAGKTKTEIRAELLAALDRAFA